jgi:sugar/nucleoside kinase (ribokinase family)
VRAALAAEGISVLLDPTPNRDTGYDIALVDCTGERSFVTAFGAEAELTAEQIGGLPLDADDLIHVSGYGLLPSTNGRVLGAFIVGLAPSHLVFVDPGPLVRDIDPAVWTTVVRRADWLSCNESEAAALTGATDARSAAGILSRSARNVLVRLGPDGCLLVSDGKVEHVQGFEVDAVDTTGAGDAHAGAFLAALAAGLSPRDAAQRANACAAIAVTRPGPATSPTLVEVLSLMR